MSLETETPNNGPAIILIEPQLGENIGTAARAMLNCGLTDLRLVRPRDSWPNPRAEAAASGATAVLERVRVFETTADAIADLTHVYATTGRLRDMTKLVVTPREAAREMRDFIPRAEACGVMFGPERTGLINDDISLADRVLTVPVNPDFHSLNLAQTVLLVAYEWFQSGVDTLPKVMQTGGSPLATREELVNFFDHLESELDRCVFFSSPEKRPNMVRNIRSVFTRSDMTRQEVRTFHGIVASLTGRPRAREN